MASSVNFPRELLHRSCSSRSARSMRSISRASASMRCSRPSSHTTPRSLTSAARFASSIALSKSESRRAPSLGWRAIRATSHRGNRRQRFSSFQVSNVTNLAVHELHVIERRRQLHRTASVPPRGGSADPENRRQIHWPRFDPPTAPSPKTFHIGPSTRARIRGRHLE